MRNGAEWKWVLVWAVAIALLGSLPYLYGIAITPPRYNFLGFTHNIDDAAVYLSWIRQAADGHFFIRNLFTNEPQAACAFNWMFFKMGVWSRLTGMSLAGTYHLTRILLAILLMFAVWQFSKLFLTEPDQRRVLIPLVGLSSGIGWLIPGLKPPVTSVDEWQPEAITFLSIYLNPLFLAGMLLMLAAFYFLLLAERTGRARHTVFAGIALLALGNVHTYDVVTAAAVWVTYVVVRAAAGCLVRPEPHPNRLLGGEEARIGRFVRLTVLAGVIAAPTTAYQFYVYLVDPVFRARANTPAVSPAAWSFFAGYGLVLLGALAGIALMFRRREFTLDSRPSTPNFLFLIVWVLVGFALPYAPVAQQRKLVMGLHFPLCILCAYAIAALAPRIPVRSRRPAVVAFVALTSITNVRFMAEDLAFLTVGTTAPRHPAYFSSNEMQAMHWLGRHTSPKDTILGPPSFSLFVPALAGRQVYYGHWSETPDYADKLREWLDFEESAQGRQALIDESQASYVVVEGTRIRPEADIRKVRLARAFRAKNEPSVFIYKVVRRQ